MPRSQLKNSKTPSDSSNGGRTPVFAPNSAFLSAFMIGLLATAFLSLGCLAEETNSSPNVIFILTDDLGYGDLSCYGQKKLKTPNIDRLASEGLTFTDFYSGNTVCSPSRFSLMAGQHPGHATCRGNAGGVRTLDPQMTTLAKVFKNAGYATGMYGKWGLGTTHAKTDENPLRHGFDVFYCWETQGTAHTYFPIHMVENGELIDVPEGTYVHDVMVEKAFAFIKKNAEQEQPFFCYMPVAIPHAAMHAPKELHEKWRKVFPQFDGKISRYGAGNNEPCPEVVNPIAGYAAMMENLDNQVGELLALLKTLTIDANTLVVFSSDNGGHSAGGHDRIFWRSSGPRAGLGALARRHLSRKRDGLCQYRMGYLANHG